MCTLASVAGGILGYLIGAVLYDSIGLWLIQLYGYGNKVESFRAAYAQWGAWIILLKGVTPIPDKVTITSGFAGYNLLLFVALSIIARGIRFFFLACLLHRYGARARLDHRGTSRILGRGRRRRARRRHHRRVVLVLA